MRMSSTIKDKDNVGLRLYRTVSMQSCSDAVNDLCWETINDKPKQREC